MADLSGPLRRKNHGKNHSYVFGNVKVPGVTTVKGILDKPALVGWAANTTAEFVADHIVESDGHLLADELWTDLRELSKLGQYPLPAKFSRTKLAKELAWVRNKVRDEAANRGTEVHALAERISAGEEVEVPEPLVGFVDAYIAFLADYEPVDVLSELAVGYRRFGGYAGTLDIICTLEGADLVDAEGRPLGEGPKRCLVDIKTSGSGIYGDTALQLAGYRFAEVYLDPETSEERPMPALDWCGVLWVRADGYDLYPFDVDETLHRDFLYLRAAFDRCRPLQWKEDPPAGHVEARKGAAMAPPKRRAS